MDNGQTVYKNRTVTHNPAATSSGIQSWFVGSGPGSQRVAVSETRRASDDYL